MREIDLQALDGLASMPILSTFGVGLLFNRLALGQRARFIGFSAFGGKAVAP